MSDEELDPARDPALAEALRRLPAPPLPEGLAERILRNAIRHPQQAAPAPIADAPTGSGGAEPTEAGRSGAGRCLRYGSVAAIAVGMIAALTLSGRVPPAGVSVPHPAPARPAALPQRPVAAPASSVPASAQSVARRTKPGPGPAPEPALAKPPRAVSALSETAPLAGQTVPSQRSGDTVPAAGPLAEDGDEPAQPALADTAGPEHRAALPQGAPVPGLGISGGRPPHGAERGGMPRF